MSSVDPRADGKAKISGDTSLWTTLSQLWPYMWPADRADLRMRVVLSMAALVLAKDGRREGGRWQYGSLGDSEDLPNSMKRLVQQAGVVLDWLPDVAEQVIAGTMALDAAYNAAKTKRDFLEVTDAFVGR